MLSNPEGDTSRILVSIRLKFFKELQEYGANEVRLLTIPCSNQRVLAFLCGLIRMFVVKCTNKRRANR